MQQLVALTRINRVESIHRGYVCVADSLDKTVWNIGDPNTKLYLRSSGKPFIAVALVNSGALEKFGITPPELAIMCSSHTGEDFHLETLRTLLKKIGLSEQYLACGAANPLNQDMLNRLIKNGERPSPIHNCCSGKHSGILALCRYYGYSTEGYNEPEHPAQQLILQTFAELLGCDREDIGLGIDGCGLPTCWISLHQIAWLYSLLAKGFNDTGKYSQCFGLIQKAMLTYPQMIAGYNEFCTDLNIHSMGRVIGKVGSEGLYCLAIPEKRLGVCIKIADGNERGVYPVAIQVLRELGILDDQSMKNLESWAYPPVKNHRGIQTGQTIPVFNLAEKGNIIGIGDTLTFRGMES